MCSEPSRLVWPIVAVALAGRSTSPLIGHGDQRVPALPFDLGDVADGHVVDPDPGVLLDVLRHRASAPGSCRSRAAALGAG